MRGCAEPASILAAVVLACSPASPQTQVREALARGGPLRLAAPGVAAELALVRFSEIVVSMDGGRALVVAMAEADGRVRAGGDDASLAYVGREAFAMRRCAGAGWCPEGEPLPGLAAVLASMPALRARSAAEAGGPVRGLSWQVRVERDRATVGEDLEASGGSRRRSVHELVRQGDAWVPAAPGSDAVSAARRAPGAGASAGPPARRGE